MSSVTIFYILSTTLILFSGMLVLYGISVPTIANQIQGPVNCDINGYPPATCTFPQFNPPKGSNSTSVSGTVPFPQCLLFIPSCFQSTIQSVKDVGTSISNLAGWILYGIGYISIFSFVFFNKLIQGILLVYGVTQIMSTDFNIPFLTYIYTAWLLFIIVFGISLIKPAGSS